MKRRLLAAIAALLLAASGAVALLAYVRGADARALAGVQTVDVLVVAQPIAAGTPGEALADLVRIDQLPAKAAAPGGVADLGQLAGRFATVDLQPGEQLLDVRFAAADDLTVPGTVAPPAGTAEVSLLLEPQRAVGGRLAAGDTVGVHVSIAGDPPTTGSVLHRVLVTQVQGAPSLPQVGEETQTASSGGAAPSDSLLITLAVAAKQAETVVFGMEHGTVWLSLEPQGADITGTKVLTPGNVYQKDYS